MGQAILLKAGGGGSGSSDVTALSSQVLEGRTAITRDSGDEPATGTMLSDANISSNGQLLEGVTAYGRHVAKYSGSLLSDATISSGGHLLRNVVAYGRNGARYVGTIDSMAGGTYTPSTSAQTITCAGKYMTGNIVIGAKPTNIVDINAGGVTYV